MEKRLTNVRNVEVRKVFGEVTDII
ncbi:hypothetical protein ig2599ANME_1740, partial [groundwater metagenome]